jgi:hypothetical protein
MLALAPQAVNCRLPKMSRFALRNHKAWTALARVQGLFDHFSSLGVVLEFTVNFRLTQDFALQNAWRDRGGGL